MDERGGEREKKKKGWRITKLQTERGQRKEEEEEEEDEEEMNGQETGEEEKMDGNVFKELAEMRKKDRDKQSTSVLYFSCFSARTRADSGGRPVCGKLPPANKLNAGPCWLRELTIVWIVC